MGIFVFLFHFVPTNQAEDFICYEDYSIADRSIDPFQENSQIFGRICGCKNGWQTTFCDNVKKYSKMKYPYAPKVCICRKIRDDKSCDQLMTRCFRDKTNEKDCTCCFNQPDNHCNQMECENMRPKFEKDSNTACVCHDQENYPVDICYREYSRGVQTTSANVDLFSNFKNKNIAEKRGSNSGRQKQNPVFYKAIWQKIQSSKLIFVFVVILVVVISAAICFGCFVICSERAKTTRTNTQKRKDRLETEKKLLEIANNQDPDQYLP